MSTTNMLAQRPAHDPADGAFKAGVRRAWAMGDYATFSRELVWELGEVVVDAARVRPGMRVLDVAAGTGNAALRAAARGARVVASDLTPEHFEAGRANARAAGVELEWVEGDAEALPFADAEFDVVMSAVGAIFAPRHQRVADEMLRVCKPGGQIAMVNFTPESLAADFFGVFTPYMPPPREGDLPPLLWGSEAHVEQLFGGRVDPLDLTRHNYVERADNPGAYCGFCKRTFGPVVAIFAELDPERAAALDAEFLRFARSANRAPAGAAAEYDYEYLLVRGAKRC